MSFYVQIRQMGKRKILPFSYQENLLYQPTSIITLEPNQSTPDVLLRFHLPLRIHSVRLEHKANIKVHKSHEQKVHNGYTPLEETLMLP